MRLIAIISFLFLLVLCPVVSRAQNRSQSNTQPLAYFQRYAYVLFPTAELTATHIKAQRIRNKKVEQLDILNVLLPSSFVTQKLIDSKDIGDTGLRIHDELLITMSILPAITSGRVDWVPISLDSLTGRQVAWPAVANDAYTRLFNYEALGGPAIDWSRRRVDLRPIIKRGSQYFTTKQTVLTEYFVLRNKLTWYPTSGDNATINCLARPFTPVDYAGEAERIRTTMGTRSEPNLRGELSTKLLLRKVENGTYTFWSLPPTIMDGGIAEFGIGELRFKPQVGIISGTYAQYFNLDVNDPSNTLFDTISIDKL